MEDIRKILEYFKKNKLYPDMKVINGSPTENMVVIDEKNILSFCSNDYLGMSNNNKVKKDACKALNIYGLGSGGSRLISGNTDIQMELESKIAKFKGGESAMIFATGYMVNLGIIPAIMNKKSNIMKFFRNNVILSDEYNHASIIDGCKLSNAKVKVYKHKDLKHLEYLLKKFKNNKKLIVTDGVFSMDGDIAPLPGIIKLAKKYNAMTMIDDAHGTGVLGENGKGTLEYFNLDSREVDIVMGTFTKAFGGVGGFVVASKELIDYLRISSKTYIFTAPIPPAICAGILSSLKIIEDNKIIINKLWLNTNKIKKSLISFGFNILNSETPIIPIYIGNERKSINFSKRLFQENIFIPAVYWPAVPKGEARLRMTVRANYDNKDIDYLLETIKIIGDELDIN